MNFGLTEQYRWRLDRLLEAVGSQDPRPHVTRLFNPHKTLLPAFALSTLYTRDNPASYYGRS